MARAKAKELNANAHKAQPYVKPDMRGRVRHDTLWQRALDRWTPGTRSFVEIRSAAVGGLQYQNQNGEREDG